MPVTSCLRPKPASPRFEIGYAACYTFICICRDGVRWALPRGRMLDTFNRAVWVCERVASHGRLGVPGLFEVCLVECMIASRFPWGNLI
jgi:hypothetical protein